ncbi:MAG: hypothetical protein NTV34_02565 [Proteobacteria bacterium]|nr:hypothetical protein [Pseudomonadota bacterium]
MSRHKFSDVMWELAEFAKELLGESRQLLNYHKASAYKDETSRQLKINIEQTRAIFEILGDDFLLDLMADVNAFEALSGQGTWPGESILTLRAGHLIKEGLPALQQYQKRVGRERGALDETRLKLIAAKKRTLMSVCKQGTRSWELLKSIA